MTYDVEFSNQAKRFLKHLDKAAALRVLEKFEQMKKDPFRYLEHYEGNYSKLRIGKIRALLDIDQTTKLIRVQVLDKRSRVYK